MSATAKLMAWLGMDAKDFNKGVDQAEHRTHKFSSVLAGMKGKLAAAFSVAAIGAGVKNIVESAGDLMHAAENLRITTDEYQALESAGKRLGLSSDDVVTALQKVMKAQEDASSAEPTKEIVENFKKLKLEADDLDRMNPAEVFAKMAEAAQTGSTQMDAAFSILGKSGPRFRAFMQGVAANGIDMLVMDASAAGKIIGEAELNALHEAELYVQDKMTLAKKMAAKGLGITVGAVTGVGRPEENSRDVIEANRKARAAADKAKADQISAEAEEIRKRTAYDALSTDEKRLALQHEMYDLEMKMAEAKTLTEKATLDKARAELEAKLSGLDGRGVVQTPVDQLRRIGANALGGGIRPDDIPHKQLTVQQRTQKDIARLLAYVEKQKGGVF